MLDHVFAVTTLRASAQAMAWLLLVFILFVTIAPVRLRPRIITQVNLDRSLAFAAMAFFFVTGDSDAPVLVGIACVVGAGLSELLQLLSPSRHAQLLDALSKSIGAAAGAFTALIASSIFSFATN